MASNQQERGAVGPNNNSNNRQEVIPSTTRPQIGNHLESTPLPSMRIDRDFRFQEVSTCPLNLTQELPEWIRAVVENIIRINTPPQPVSAGIAQRAWLIENPNGPCRRRSPQDMFFGTCFSDAYTASGVNIHFRTPFSNDKHGAVCIIGHSDKGISPVFPIGRRLSRDIRDDSGRVNLPFMSIEVCMPGLEPMTSDRRWISECETRVAAIEAMCLNRQFSTWMEKTSGHIFDAKLFLHFGLQITNEDARLFASTAGASNAIVMKHVRTWSLVDDAAFTDFRAVMHAIMKWGVERTRYIQLCMMRIKEHVDRNPAGGARPGQQAGGSQ